MLPFSWMVTLVCSWVILSVCFLLLEFWESDHPFILFCLLHSIQDDSFCWYNILKKILWLSNVCHRDLLHYTKVSSKDLSCVVHFYSYLLLRWLKRYVSHMLNLSSTSKKLSSHISDLLTRTHFPNSVSPNVGIFCNLGRLKISSVIK